MTVRVMLQGGQQFLAELDQAENAEHANHDHCRRLCGRGKAGESALRGCDGVCAVGHRGAAANREDGRNNESLDTASFGADAFHALLCCFVLCCGMLCCVSPHARGKLEEGFENLFGHLKNRPSYADGYDAEAAKAYW